jgi:hypothetical protein
MQEAQKEKVTEEHNVIDEAIRDRGEGYTVFSIVRYFRSSLPIFRQDALLFLSLLETVIPSSRWGCPNLGINCGFGLGNRSYYHAADIQHVG